MADTQPTYTQTEIWKPIPGYEGRYEVSNQGRVRSLDRTVPGKDGRVTFFKGRELQPWVSNGGHLVVGLGRNRREYVHRLVLFAFVGPCPAGMEACHINDCPADNRVVNLRWDTRSENGLDRRRNGINTIANKTHCKHGHEFTPENTHIRPNGSRLCKACRLRRKREENARKRTQS